MLSNKETAAQVEKAMRQCSELLNDSVRRVMETCPETEFKDYRHKIATIMASLYLEVMQPIHLRYPDLEPEQLRRPQ